MQREQLMLRSHFALRSIRPAEAPAAVEKLQVGVDGRRLVEA
jgi:hypothetical protein